MAATFPLFLLVLLLSLGDDADEAVRFDYATLTLATLRLLGDATCQYARRRGEKIEEMAMAVSGQWTHVRTLGCGASGAEVFLAADDVSGELFAVKSAGPAGAEGLRREQGLMAGLRCPRVVSSIGSYQRFLEFAPGGSVSSTSSAASSSSGPASPHRGREEHQ